MTTYIALTIGPIYRTLSMARKTRELWAASYLFDWLSRRIAGELINQYGEDIEFVKPRLTADQRERIANGESLMQGGIGNFPDQLIVKSKHTLAFLEIHELVFNIILDVAERVHQALREPRPALDDVVNYLRDYLQIYFLVLEADGVVIPEINRLLGTLELQRNFPQLHQPFLEGLLENVRTSWLAEEAFGGGQFSIPSLPQIALASILNRADGMEAFSDDDDGSQLMRLAFNLSEEQELAFHQAHRYVAIVKFDGDNLGELLARGEGVARGISSGLVNFATQAVDLIRDYGGFPVFIGGDDALFFAPVVSEIDGEKCNVFDLLVDLDEAFANVFEDLDLPEDAHRPTLSFGASITYYKYPMYEALQAADELLFEKAKSEQKHNIAFRILKHSGSDFEAVLPIGSDLFGRYRVLIDNAFRESGLPFHSVVYKIKEAKAVFDEIGKNEKALIAFITNSFNEAVHENKREFFVEGLVPMIISVYEYYPLEEANDRLFDLLKSILFLTQTEKTPKYE